MLNKMWLAESNDHIRYNIVHQIYWRCLITIITHVIWLTKFNEYDKYNIAL